MKLFGWGYDKDSVAISREEAASLISAAGLSPREIQDAQVICLTPDNWDSFLFKYLDMDPDEYACDSPTFPKCNHFAWVYASQALEAAIKQGFNLAPAFGVVGDLRNQKTGVWHDLNFSLGADKKLQFWNYGQPLANLAEYDLSRAWAQI